MKKQINIEAGSVTFSFEDGLESITVFAADLPEAVQHHAKLHGIAQKVGDSAAIPKSAENSYTVTEAMRRDAVLEMSEQIKLDWNAKREAGKSAATAQSLKAAIEVLMDLMGCTYEEAVAQIAAKKAA